MTKVQGPHVDFAAISPLIALAAGAVIVLMAGLVRSRFVRARVVPGLAVVSLGAAIGLSVWQWDTNTPVIADAMAIDPLTLALTILFCVGGIAAILMAIDSEAADDAGHGEFHALLLASVLGMVVLAGATDMIALFIGFELLSIPLYVLCASELRRATSLESGLKYLIVGSVGSATLVYGLAFVYGATGATGYDEIRNAIETTAFDHDVLLLTGVALAVTGLAFKASVAPFHQWTPDVYEGAPTPVTAFMAVATKAAAFGVLLRFFDVALIGTAQTWAPILAVLATITIVVGNVGALGQSSLKRMLAYSSVAQAGYMLTGVVVSTSLGVAATTFYLGAYLLMNLAAFGVIAARERSTGRGDDLSAMNGLVHRVARPRLGHDHRHARPRRLPGHRRLLRQGLPDRGRRRQRLRLARRGHRARLRHLPRLLPARRRRHLGAAGGRVPRPHPDRPARHRRRRHRPPPARRRRRLRLPHRHRRLRDLPAADVRRRPGRRRRPRLHPRLIPLLGA